MTMTPLPGPYTQQLMQGSGARAVGNVLQNLGMGIMGLAQKNPQAAMAGFGRRFQDPRVAMMDAARLDMATQQMAAQQAKAAREAQVREERARLGQDYLGTIDDPAERIRAELIGAAEHAEMISEAGLEGPDLPTGIRLNPTTGEREIDPLWIEQQSYKKPLVQLQQGAKVPENYRPVYNTSGELERVEPIPGGPADLATKSRTYTPEQAGRTAAQMNAVDSVRNVRDYLIDKDGKVNFDNVADMNLPVLGMSVPWTEGRQRRQEFLDALSAQLRAETGAAATPAELENMAERYLPAVGDTDEAVASKLDRLEKVLEKGIGLTDPARNVRPQAGGDSSDPLGIR